jgi:membrane protease YdiL (CAAX protease family)
MLRKAVAETPVPLIRRAATVALICASALPLLIFTDFNYVGWLLLSGALMLSGWDYPSRFSKYMVVQIAAIALLGIMPISTDIAYDHMAYMGAVLILTIAVPYIAMKLWVNEPVITFPWKAGRKWYAHELAYIGIAALVAYLFLPIYLVATDSYLNWSVDLDVSSIIRLFLGTNVLGIWDELFFVGICLTLLRQHLPFIWANIAQATLWTIFLYELGFRGWGPIVIFAFALSQGYIFRATKSLLYIVSVHLVIDFILFLALIHLHHPEVLRIFITSPI